MAQVSRTFPAVALYCAAGACSEQQNETSVVDEESVEQMVDVSSSPESMSTEQTDDARDDSETGGDEESDSSFDLSDWEELELTAPRDPENHRMLEAIRELNDGATEFAFDLHTEILRGLEADDDPNFVFSPHSIRTALSMTLLGARNHTETEMVETLHFGSDLQQAHAANNQLLYRLDSRNLPEEKDEFGDLLPAVTLEQAHGVFSRLGIKFRQTYLDELHQFYGTKTLHARFTEIERFRLQINDWVSQRTDEKIEELLLPESVPSKPPIIETYSVLVEALFVKAPWLEPFAESRQYDAFFTNLQGEKEDVNVISDSFRDGLFGDFDDATVASLAFRGGSLSFVVVEPKESFLEFESSLDSDDLNNYLDDLSYETFEFSMPELELSFHESLRPGLVNLGMETTFYVPGGKVADFSGAVESGTDWPLEVIDVVHAANWRLDHRGCEGSAATAVVQGGGFFAPPPDPVATATFQVDRPFLFFVMDAPTGTILFQGRVVTLKGSQPQPVQ